MALAALACCAMLLSPVRQIPQTNAEKLQLYDRIRKCTVKVNADFATTRNHGTGIGLRRFGDYVAIITNSHVIAQNGGISGKVTVKPFSRTGAPSLPAYVLFDYQDDDSYLDLAFLIVKDPGQTIAIAEKGTNPNWRNERVYSCGNPQEEEFLVDHGTVVPKSAVPLGLKGLDWVVLHDALVEHGNSGGGLFDSAGKLVAINSWLLGGKTAMAIDFSLFDNLFDLRSTAISAWESGWKPETRLPPSSSLFMIAIGKWTPNPAWPDVNAGGFSTGGSSAAVSGYPYGSLLVKMGGQVSCFNHGHLGERGASVAYPDARTVQVKDATGDLSLRINDAASSDNSGQMRVFYVVMKG